MADARPNRALIGECISRAQLDGVADVSLEAIAAELARCDFERAALIAFARAKRGEAVPIAVVAEILPGLELVPIAEALIAVATGNRLELLEAVELRRFPATAEALDLEVIAVFAAWQGGAPIERLIPELRRLASRSVSVEGYALLGKIAAAIADPNVSAATKHLAPLVKEYAKQIAADERALAMSTADAIASLPAEIETVRATGFTVRSAKEVGRNDPCSCGSGLKYKKCCADKPQVTPSPIPGVSWDDFLGASADRMTAAHVEELALRDLATVDPTRLGHEARIAACGRFIAARRFDNAERVLAAFGDVPDPIVDELRDDLVDGLLAGADIDRARSHVARLPDTLAPLWNLELAIAEESPDAWPGVAALMDEIAFDPGNELFVEHVASLLRTAPGLGIVVARSLLGAVPVETAEMLLNFVEDARDRLNLPPTDPAWDVLDKLDARRIAKPGESEEAGELRSSLHASAARADELERSLAATRAQLEDARTRPAAELARGKDKDDSALESKVTTLEAMIREGNAERRELRRQLAGAHAVTSEAPRPARPAPEVVDSDDGDDLDPRARGIAIPRFDRRATDALAGVPAAVASEAMRTIGTLAAGDGFAWSRVKQAKDMTTQVLMARVGIHHRLIFRSTGDGLEVLDLITREQLMTTLKRLRSAR